MTAPSLGPTFGLHSSARVTGATGAVTNNVNLTQGVRNGLGDYTLTLGSAIDPTQRCAQPTILGAVAGSAVVNPAGESDSTFNVLVFNAAGAAADLDFSVCVFRTSVPS